MVFCNNTIASKYFLEISYADPKDDLEPYELMITGLKGGHSGMDIVIGRANAIKLLGRLLLKLEDVKYRISDIAKVQWEHLGSVTDKDGNIIQVVYLMTQKRTKDSFDDGMP